MNAQEIDDTVAVAPVVWCPECGHINQTDIQHFPHKALVISTCLNPECKLFGATLGAGTVGVPDSRASIGSAPTLQLWKVVAHFDWRTGKSL